jgi:hypothetical protein
MHFPTVTLRTRSARLRGAAFELNECGGSSLSSTYGSSRTTPLIVFQIPSHHPLVFAWRDRHGCVWTTRPTSRVGPARTPVAISHDQRARHSSEPRVTESTVPNPWAEMGGSLSGERTESQDFCSSRAPAVTRPRRLVNGLGSHPDNGRTGSLHRTASRRSSHVWLARG